MFFQQHCSITTKQVTKVLKIHVTWITSPCVRKRRNKPVNKTNIARMMKKPSVNKLIYSTTKLIN